MSTSISTSFVAQYEREVKHVFQREGSSLRPAVRTKDNVVGSTTTMQKIGKGTATTKARHGTVTPMNQTHTAVTITLADFYAGDWVDKLDEAKVNHDERLAIARGGAYALGRKVDNQIITALDATTQSAVTITTSSYANTKATMLTLCEALDSNNVPNDGLRYGIVTPRLHSQLMEVTEFASSDYVMADSMPYEKGTPLGQRWRYWNGVLWKVHTDCPSIGTASAKVFVWHKFAIGYAAGRHAGNVASNEMVSADITWHGDRAAHFVNHAMSGGSTLIDDTGCIEGSQDDTQAVATS